MKQPTTDDQIEKFVYRLIKKKDIRFTDMIAGSHELVDPDPGNQETDCRARARSNRFSSFSEADRMIELLADVDCTYLDHIPQLKISFQDLFRFWWNRCVDQQLAVEMVLEDIFSYFREEMRPQQAEPEQLDLTVDFNQLNIPDAERKLAA